MVYRNFRSVYQFELLYTRSVQNDVEYGADMIWHLKIRAGNTPAFYKQRLA